MDDALFRSSNPAAALRVVQAVSAAAERTGLVYETGDEGKSAILADGLPQATVDELQASSAGTLMGGSPRTPNEATLLGVPLRSHHLGEQPLAADALSAAAAGAEVILREVVNRSAIVRRNAQAVLRERVLCKHRLTRERLLSQQLLGDGATVCAATDAHGFRQPHQ